MDTANHSLFISRYFVVSGPELAALSAFLCPHKASPSAPEEVDANGYARGDEYCTDGDDDDPGGAEFRGLGLAESVGELVAVVAVRAVVG